MLHWSMYEINDIMWGDCYEKGRRKEMAVRKNAGDSDLMRRSANYSSISSLSNGLCDDGIVGNMGDPHNGSLYGFLHYGNNCSTRSDLGADTNEGDADGRGSHSHYDWPGIGNSEEVDKMFRNADSSLFGQGNTGYDQQMSWLSSSSPSVDVSEDAFRSAFITPCSELRSTSKNGEGGTDLLPDSLTPLIADFDRKNVLSTYRASTQAPSADDSSTLGHSYSNCLGAEDGNRGIYMYTEQIHLQGKQANSLHQSQGNTEEQFPEYFCGDSLHSSPCEGQRFENEECPTMLLATQVSPPSAILQRNESLGFDASSNLDKFIPNVQFKFPFTSSQNQITPIRSSTESGINAHFPSNNVSYASIHVPPVERSGNPSLKVADMTSEESIENFYLSSQKQVASAVLSEHEDVLANQVKAVITNKLPDWKQLQHSRNIVGYRGVEQENTDFDDSSSVATSFWDLQCISEQLDIKTKLCIRDSLYRLARSAEQRHNFGNVSSSGSDSEDRRGALTTEEANKCSRFMDMEADTNAIDRSIAHLLFNRPSDTSWRPFNYASSLESCAISSHIFSPTLSFMFA